jgi:hypothetical protein
MPQTARASTRSSLLRVIVALVLVTWIAAYCLDHAESADSSHHAVMSASPEADGHHALLPSASVSHLQASHEHPPGSSQGCHNEAISAPPGRTSVFQPAVAPPAQLRVASILLPLVALLPQADLMLARTRVPAELGVLRL